MARKVELRSKSLAIFLLAFFLLISTSVTWARPTTADQAAQVVKNWLSLDSRPLGAPMGQQVKEVQTFPGPQGASAYYVVYLNPAGLVFLPADDLVEPIIGFMPEGTFDPSPANPLGALVSNDIPSRVLKARESESQTLEKGTPLAPQSTQAMAQRKWAWLANPTTGQEGLESGLPSISDVRVVPFLQSKWNQAGSDGSLPDPACNHPCYNYFTPPYDAGNSGNYVCGCVATAMAQLMRYWRYPTAGIGVHSYTYYISGSAHTGSTRGGDDSGGAYAWSNMPLTTNSSTSLAQRQAIGRLTWDAGLSVNMNYDTVVNHGPGSATDTLLAANAFVNTFRYSNAIAGLPGIDRNAMVNPNLHARYPVLLGITGTPGGHAIVCDGYGYNIYPTIYHHLNMGWSGTDDTWYNLPTIDTSNGTFTSVYKCVYNVYTSGSGEIIAGRVTDTNGKPLSGAIVYATGGYLATTDYNGIYALTQVPHSTTFTVNATAAGYNFTSQTVTTGTSTNNSSATGNLWNINFVGLQGPPPFFSIKKIDTMVKNGKNIDLWGNSPDMNDRGQVTFNGDLDGYGNLFLYIPTSGVIQMTDTKYYHGSSEINNFGQIIWREGTPDLYYILSAGQKYTMLGTNYNVSSHDFSNGGFVWLDGNDNQIYLYANGSITRINGDSTLNYPPSINNKGEVVWRGFPPGALYPEIYLYGNGGRQIINRGTSNSLVNSPKINNKSQIFWFDVSYGKICRYENGTTTNICYFPGIGTARIMKVNDLGEVAFVISDYQIHCFRNGVTFKVYEGVYIKDMQLNNLSQISWVVQSEDGHQSLYVFYSSKGNNNILQLDSTAGIEGHKLNNLGQIVWGHYKYPVPKNDLYLATPQNKRYSPAINQLLLSN